MLPALVALGLAGLGAQAVAQTTIFSENIGTPTGTTAISTYASGTAPATFQNKATLTYGSGDAANSADVRSTSSSIGYAGASGGGNVFFTSTAGERGFSIESINASGFTGLQLSYAYRKETNPAHATFSVDYWNGSAWVTIANTAVDLFNEAASTTSAWFPAKSLSLPSAAQIAGLKIRFVKSGGTAIRIDDIKLTGTPAGGDITPPALSSVLPSSGATEVSINAVPTAAFNEAVKAGAGAITITNNTTSMVIPSAVSFAGSSVSIVPNDPLLTNTSYTVNIPTGAVLDLADNPYSGTTWTFTTDNTGPSLTSTLVPPNGAVNVIPPSVLTATFNEPINLPDTAGTSSITIRNAGGTAVATFDPWVFGDGVSASGNVLTLTLPVGTALDYGASYYVEIGAGAVQNDSGLPFAGYTGNSVWSFTTVDVPTITTGPGYSQDFATFTSGTNLPDARPLLPQGWFVSSDQFTPDFTFDGNFGIGTTGGFRGNGNVLGYQHTGSTGILTKTLVLRNDSGAEITDLIIGYAGRDAGPAGTGERNPVYTVRVNGAIVSGLAYSTADGNNVARSAQISGLSIPADATFSVTWASDSNAPGTGARRQIGISAVSVAIGTASFPPTVLASVPLSGLTHNSADFNATVQTEGTSPITERGFVYSQTSLNSAPELGGANVTTIIDAEIGADPYTTSVTGLSSETSYTVRSYAINAVGTSYSAAVTFTTLAQPPTFTGLYEQPFDNYNGTNPAGWSTVSSGGAQSYLGAWGSGTAAGFTGGLSDPGVLGYQHTGASGTLTTTLRLVNGTGTTITSLPVSYLGRVARITEGRSPAFTVSVNGTDVPALAYSTAGNADLTVSTTVTGLNIAPGALITITWVSERGGPSGASKQIGLGEVIVGGTPGGGNTYADWATANATTGAPATGDHDNDGVLNGVEYFMGSTGSTFTANQALGPLNKIIWPKNPNFTGTFTVQTSPDLLNWTDVSSTVVNDTVEFTLTGPGPKFVRLKVVP